MNRPVPTMFLHTSIAQGVEISGRLRDEFAAPTLTFSVQKEIHVDAARGMSSSTDVAESPEDDNSVDLGLVLPSRISTRTSPCPSIFTARKKELHFFSDQFLQDFESWFQDNDDEEDNSDDEYHAPVAASSSHAE
jgi:hypothetical protein